MKRVTRKGRKLAASRPGSQTSSRPDGVGEEYLCGRVDPALAGDQLGPVRGDVEEQAVTGPRQGHRTEQQNYHHEVGKEGGEPDDLEQEKRSELQAGINSLIAGIRNLSRGVKSFPYDDVDDDPGKQQGPDQLPLNASEHLHPGSDTQHSPTASIKTF